MRIRRNNRLNDDAEMQMTPMIDIVFQLLIFFLLSAKFIALEGQLASYLPKDRGLQSTFVPMDLVNVILFLEWVPGEDRVQCQTIDYKPPGGGDPVREYTFRTVDARSQPTAYGPASERKMVKYGYQVPDFDEIELYMQHRHDAYTGGKKSIPVTINVADEVPSQMVINLVDICTRVGISDVTIAAKEVPIE